VTPPCREIQSIQWAIKTRLAAIWKARRATPACSASNQTRTNPATATAQAESTAWNEIDPSAVEHMPTDIDQKKRTELMDKISALLAKTTANGCTEAEAITAAELAEKMMAKYGLSLAELETVKPGEACEADGTPIGNRRAHEVAHVSWAIACYTNTRRWNDRHGRIHASPDSYRQHKHRGIIVVYFGLATDVHVAIYLTNTLRVAMDSEWQAYWQMLGKTSETSLRTARANFMRGMAERLGDRLCEMKQQQDQATNNCRAIVLAKDRIVTEAFKAFGIKFTIDISEPRSDAAAFKAGSVAGERITIARGALTDG
jgi:hypothetical protein